MKLTTCLWFDGNAREAATFYTSIFPDSSVADSWIAPTETPGNDQGSEVFVNFTIFGQPFIGSMADLNFHTAKQSRFRFRARIKQR
jgi:predicted 3-demethylubiquinone-9 3-methyltransferase (glyoxalase superfamily)